MVINDETHGASLTLQRSHRSPRERASSVGVGARDAHAARRERAMASSPRSRTLGAVRDAPVAPGSPPVVVEDVNDDLEGCRVSAHPDAAEVAGLGPSAAPPSPKTKPRVSLGSAFGASAPPAVHARGFTPPSASSKSVSPTHVPGGFVPSVLEELLGAPLPRPTMGGGVGGAFPAPPGGSNAASPRDAHARTSPGVTTPRSGPAAPTRRTSFNANAAIPLATPTIFSRSSPSVEDENRSTETDSQPSWTNS